MYNNFDLLMALMIYEERLRWRRRESVDLGPFWAKRSQMAVEGRTGNTSGFVHALQSAARAVLSYVL
jgi:hypothetical protein